MNFKNHETIGMLKTSLDIGLFDEDSVDEFHDHGTIEGIDHFWEKNKTKISQNIIVPTKTFMNAFDLSADKMIDLYNDFINEDDRHCLYTGAVLINHMTYYFSNEKKIGNTRVYEILGFNGRGLVFTLVFKTIGDGLANRYAFRSNKLMPNRSDDEILEDIESMCKHFCLLFLFKEYGNVETKILPPKTKLKAFHSRYNNKTNHTFQILDSTWFTNLVQSNGFSVRGHFRLQPKKHKGKWTKELIWIDSFEKKGYNMKAKKLN